MLKSFCSADLDFYHYLRCMRMNSQFFFCDADRQSSLQEEYFQTGFFISLLKNSRNMNSTNGLIYSIILSLKLFINLNLTNIYVSESTQLTLVTNFKSACIVFMWGKHPEVIDFNWPLACVTNSMLFPHCGVWLFEQPISSAIVHTLVKSIDDKASSCRSVTPSSETEVLILELTLLK